MKRLLGKITRMVGLPVLLLGVALLAVKFSKNIRTWISSANIPFLSDFMGTNE